MHVIVGMWGMLRSLSFTIASIRTFILQPLERQGFTFELFVHTYNMTGVYQNLRNREAATTLNVSLWKELKPGPTEAIMRTITITQREGIVLVELLRTYYAHAY